MNISSEAGALKLLEEREGTFLRGTSGVGKHLSQLGPSLTCHVTWAAHLPALSIGVLT